MNEYDRLHRQAQRYKELYPKGTRILLLHMGNDPRPVEDDMRGTVIAVDDNDKFVVNGNEVYFYDEFSYIYRYDSDTNAGERLYL